MRAYRVFSLENIVLGIRILTLRSLSTVLLFSISFPGLSIQPGLPHPRFRIWHIPLLDFICLGVAQPCNLWGVSAGPHYPRGSQELLSLFFFYCLWTCIVPLNCPAEPTSDRSPVWCHPIQHNPLCPPIYSPIWWCVYPGNAWHFVWKETVSDSTESFTEIQKNWIKWMGYLLIKGNWVW